MDTDLLLVVGLTVFALSIPSMLSAWVEGRVPRIGSIMVLIGGVLIVVALNSHGPGYTLHEIPDVFIRVIGRYVN